MKHIKKFTAFLLSVCLAVFVLCVSASAASSDVYGIVVYTAPDSEQLPIQFKGSSYVDISPTTFTFPSPQLMTWNEKEWKDLPGYEFLGWKTEGDDTLYQSGDVIEKPQNLTRNIEYYGQWKATHPFTDLDGTWDQLYGILFCYEQGLMNGTSDTTFSPHDTLTRAMLWTVLARMNGAEISGSGWAEQARTWVMENGVSDGTYPDQAVTRQELAAMLYRQAGSPDTYSDTLVNFTPFPDSAQTAAWAREAVWWASNTGVLSIGCPTEYATRTQVAYAVTRFCKFVERGADVEH